MLAFGVNISTVSRWCWLYHVSLHTRC